MIFINHLCNVLNINMLNMLPHIDNYIHILNMRMLRSYLKEPQSIDILINRQKFAHYK